MRAFKKEWSKACEANRTIEVAKNMLSAGSDISFISKVTGLSISEINKLSGWGSCKETEKELLLKYNLNKGNKYG